MRKKKKKINYRQECYCTCDCSFRKSGSWNSPLKTWKHKGPGLDVYSSNWEKAWLLSPPSRHPTTTRHTHRSPPSHHCVCVCTTKCKKSDSVARVSYSAPDGSPSAWNHSVRRWLVFILAGTGSCLLCAERGQCQSTAVQGQEGAGAATDTIWRWSRGKLSRGRSGRLTSELQQGAAVKQERLNTDPGSCMCCVGNYYHTPCVNHAQLPRVNRAALRRGLLVTCVLVTFIAFHIYFCAQRESRRWCQQMPSDFPQADSFSGMMGALRGTAYKG